MNGTKNKNNKKYNSSKVAKLERTKKVKKKWNERKSNNKNRQKENKKKKRKKGWKGMKNTIYRCYINLFIPYTIFSQKSVSTLVLMFSPESISTSFSHTDNIYFHALFKISKVVFVSGIPTLDRSKKFY